MKQLKHDLWTDGEHEYTGNPKQGFTKIEKSDSTVEASAMNLKQPKNTIMDDIRKAQEECPNCEGDHPYEECEEDNWTFSHDDFKEKKVDKKKKK